MPRGDFDPVTKVTLAAHCDEGCMGMIDLYLPDGRKFCRVNVMAYLNGSGGTVDVCMEAGQLPTAHCWIGGESVLHKPLEGAKFVTVDIRQGPVVKTGPKPAQERAYATV